MSDNPRARRPTIVPVFGEVVHDPFLAVERVRGILAAEIARTSTMAGGLDLLAREVERLRVACVRHVSEARENGRKAGFAAGLDRAAKIADALFDGDSAKAIRELAKEF